jgi:hypothetical protein
MEELIKAESKHKNTFEALLVDFPQFSNIENKIVQQLIVDNIRITNKNLALTNQH